jgi:hypothetical protein
MKTRLFIIVLALVLMSFSAISQTHLQSAAFSLDKNTKEFALDSGKGDRVAQIEITFATPFESKPEIAIAVSSLDASKDTNLRYSVKAIGVSRDGFTLQVKTWDDSKIFGIGGTWIAYTNKK